MAIIEIEAEEVEPIGVKLVGVEYLLTPPKTAIMMDMAEVLSDKKFDPKDPEKMGKAGGKAMESLNAWLIQAFGKEGHKEIRKRLKDPGDLLDWKHLMKLMTQVSEVVSGDPTT